MNRLSGEKTDLLGDLLVDILGETSINHMIDKLARHHFCVLPQALPTGLVSQLRSDFDARSSQFRPAKIVRGHEVTAQASIRNDEICWIDETDLRAGEQALFEILDALRLHLNRTLYLGLTDFEAHYALYETGHYYAPHVDRFRDDDARLISVVIYLNSDWSENDGGQLRLLMAPPVEISPTEGTIVCFTSAEIEHEVLPARRPRMSVAAWFRKSPSPK